MSALSSLSGHKGLAVDGNALNDLKRLAGEDSGAALKETARQFEALFMRELLKSMREATMKSGLMDSQEEELSTGMLDEQLALKLTGLPGGLSEMIERQLSRQVTTAPPGEKALPATGGASTLDRVQGGERQSRFVEQHRHAAQAVARETGIPASFMIGQAGHETGWGRSEIRTAGGGNSFNLFGIKATAGWTGRVAEITTTEYVDGEPRKMTAKFRAYDSYEDAFRDYARLISQSPRYAKAMENLHSAQGFAQGLQQGGYATDPQYAAKLSRAINTTLQLQRAQA